MDTLYSLQLKSLISILKCFLIGFIIGAIIALRAYSDSNLNYKVGVSLPLSGDLAEFGTAVKNGIELAVLDNPNNYKNIEFVYEDNQYSPTLAVTTLRKFVSLDKIDLLFIWGDHPSLAVAPIAESNKLPTVAVLTDSRNTLNSKYVIRFSNAYEEYSLKMLEYLRSNKTRNIGLIMVQDPYYVNLLEGLRSNLNKDEKLEVAANVGYDESDFKTIVSKIKHKNYDALGVYLLPGQVSTFYNQLSQQRVKVKTFGADVFESQEEIRKANGNMEGAVFAHNYVSDDYRRKYVAKFGNDYQLAYSAQAYEFAKLLDSLNKHTKLSDNVLLQAFRLADRQVNTTLGDFAFVKNTKYGDYFKFRINVKQIVNGNVNCCLL